MELESFALSMNQFMVHFELLNTFGSTYGRFVLWSMAKSTWSNATNSSNNNQKKGAAQRSTLVTLINRIIIKHRWTYRQISRFWWMFVCVLCAECSRCALFHISISKPCQKLRTNFHHNHMTHAISTLHSFGVHVSMCTEAKHINNR